MYKRNKGFTLTEILGVIAILAILMISASSAVVNIMNNSKMNNFKNEVLVMMEGAESLYSAVSMEPAYRRAFITENTNGKYNGMCVTLPGLVSNGYLEKDIKSYAGVLFLEIPKDGGATKIMAWVHNSKYGVNGLERNLINGLKYNEKKNGCNGNSCKDTPRKDASGNVTGSSYSDPTGGDIILTTRLEGIKKIVGLAYNVPGTAVGIPSGLNNNGYFATSGSTSLQLYSDHGGTDNQYMYTRIRCINTKMNK